MSQPTPEGREIDSRLEELDRRLRAVQDELLPERESRPVRAAAPAPEPPEPPEPPDPPEPPPPPEPPEPPPPRPPDPPSAPPPPRPAPPPPPAAAIPVPPPPDHVTAVHSKLVSSLRELLDAYESLLAQFPLRPERPPAPEPPAREPESITAGPFVDTDAVRAFRDSLAALPGVATVRIRAYEGQDRAVFDVKLTEPRLPDGSA